MTFRAWNLWCVLAASALSVTACARSLESVVRSRAASDLSCPAADIRVRETGAGGMRAEGCGLSASYVCVGRTCVREGGAELAGAAERSDESMHRALEAARGGLVACIPESGGLRIRITVDVMGRVTQAVPADDATERMRDCIARAFADVSIDEAASRPRTVTMRVPSGWRDGPTSAAVAEPAVAEPAVDAAAEATARRAIDANRDAILACVGATTVALAVSYAVDGSVTVALRGALAESAEERCVVAALGDVRLDPPPSAPGTVIHAVTN